MYSTLMWFKFWMHRGQVECSSITGTALSMPRPRRMFSVPEHEIGDLNIRIVAGKIYLDMKVGPIDKWCEEFLRDKLMNAGIRVVSTVTSHFGR